MPPNQRYRIPSRVSTRTLLSAVAEESKVVVGPQVGLLREYLDTADWRAQGRGRQVELDRSTCPGRGVMFDLARPGDRIGDRLGRPGLGAALRDDLPKRQPWSELSDVIEGRRLLVQAEASVGSQVASGRQSGRQDDVRIYLERVTLSGPAGRHRVLRTAAVAAVRGYERSVERVCGVLDALGLQHRDQTVLELALEALGRAGPGAPPGPGVLLDRTQPAHRRWPSCLLACASTW